MQAGKLPEQIDHTCNEVNCLDQLSLLYDQGYRFVEDKSKFWAATLFHFSPSSIVLSSSDLNDSRPETTLPLLLKMLTRNKIAPSNIYISKGYFVQKQIQVKKKEAKFAWNKSISIFVFAQQAKILSICCRCHSRLTWLKSFAVTSSNDQQLSACLVDSTPFWTLRTTEWRFRCCCSTWDRQRQKF